MRKKDVRGMVNDLLHLNEDFNPLDNITLKDKLEANLVTGEIFYVDEDDVYKFYKQKVFWFKDRVEILNGNLGDFKKARILVHLNKETVKINYKGEEFSESRVF